MRRPDDRTPAPWPESDPAEDPTDDAGEGGSMKMLIDCWLLATLERLRWWRDGNDAASRQPREDEHAADRRAHLLTMRFQSTAIHLSSLDAASSYDKDEVVALTSEHLRTTLISTRRSNASSERTSRSVGLRPRHTRLH